MHCWRNLRVSRQPRAGRRTLQNFLRWPFLHWFMYITIFSKVSPLFYVIVINRNKIDQSQCVCIVSSLWQTKAGTFFCSPLPTLDFYWFNPKDRNYLCFYFCFFFCISSTIYWLYVLHSFLHHFVNYLFGTAFRVRLRELYFPNTINPLYIEYIHRIPNRKFSVVFVHGIVLYFLKTRDLVFAMVTTNVLYDKLFIIRSLWHKIFMILIKPSTITLNGYLTTACSNF